MTACSGVLLTASSRGVEVPTPRLGGSRRCLCGLSVSDPRARVVLYCCGHRASPTSSLLAAAARSPVGALRLHEPCVHVRADLSSSHRARLLETSPLLRNVKLTAPESRTPFGKGSD